jgi:hypothetical protein
MPFNLTDRSHKKTKILVNKEFMKKAGLIINPAMSFLLSLEPEKN